MKLFRELENIFPKIEPLFDDQTMAYFLNGAYSELNQYHLSLGLWIRNNLLQENTSLYKLLVTAGITEKDDMSAFVIQQFYIYNRMK